MKLLVVTGIALIVSLNAYTQYGTKKGHYKEVTVGQKMPDISFGDVINNTTGKTKFSQLNKKLIILAFWNCLCGSCIEEFPELVKLQQKFQKEIQIFLVNPEENRQQVKEFRGLNILPTALPAILGAEKLKQIFPIKGGEIGYHVWINEKGIVQLRGNGIYNTYEQKIRDFLAGKPLSYISDAGKGVYNKNYPFSSFLDRSKKPILQYSSLFTQFADDLASYFGVEANKIDSPSQTIRNSYLNKTVLDLFNEAVREEIKDKRILWGDQILLYVNDTTDYIDRKPWYSGVYTDDIYRRSRYCYEQIISLDLNDSLRRRYMLEDLNRYFKNTYDAEGKVEEQKISCYVLIRTSTEDKLKSKAGGRIKYSYSVENGTNMVTFQGFKLNEIFSYIHDANTSICNNDFLLDETGITEKVDMKIPDAYKMKLGMEDLKTALQPYGLDIVKKEREIKMLVIREQDYSFKNLNVSNDTK